MSDPRFKQCPEGCGARLLVDAVNCTRCGWHKDANGKSVPEVDSAGRARRCSCGQLASMYDSHGVPACSACDAQRRFGEVREGPGYDVWKRALERQRRAPARAREPGDDDEVTA